MSLKKLFRSAALMLLGIFAFTQTTNACNLSSFAVDAVNDNGDGTYTITVTICFGVDVNWGAVTDFSLTNAGGTFSSISSIQSGTWTSTYQYCAAGCGFMGCADGAPPITGGGSATGSIMGGAINFNGGGGAGNWLAPDDLDATCINQAASVCGTITYTTVGLPGTITLNFDEGTDPCGWVATLPPPVACTPPTASFNLPATACEGSSFNFSNTGSTGSNMGSALYTYDWSFTGGTPSTSTAEDPTGITWASGGTYGVTLTVCDASDPTCCATVTQNLVVASPPTLSITGVDETCAGANDGSANLTVSGGSPGYSYSWSNGPTTQDVGGLAPGTYTVTVTDAAGCVETISVTIAVGAGPTAGFSFSGSGCLTGNSFDFTNTGSTGANMGSPLFNYDWDFGGGGAGTSTSEDPSGVSYNAAGAYTVSQTVTDIATGCTAVFTAVVNVFPEPVITFTAVDETCDGANDGSIDVTITGGTAGFTYSWNTGPTTQDLSGLAPGTYTLTVTDANNCTDVLPITINPGITLSAGFTYNGNQCLTGNSYVFTNTGTTGATYSWDFGDGSGTSTAQNPSYTYGAAGTYTVTQTITQGACVEVATVNVVVYPMPTVTVTGTDLSCNGICDGTVTAVGAGGSGGFTYNWGAAGTGATLTGLCAGTYNVTVTDINSCTVTGSVTIAEPPVLTVTAAATDVSCFGLCDGTLTSTPAGGTSPYSYSWDGGAGNTQNPTGICAGTYTVTVTDANGCTATASATITAPPLLTVTATGVDVSCFGLCDGDVGSSAAGGTTPYTYSWNGGLGAGQNITGTVCAGTYTVTVTDANGCTATAAIVVNEPAVMAVTATATPASCFGVCDGTVTANLPTGGTPPFTYAWDGGLGAGSSQTGVCAGTYTVTATDANGCTTTATVTVTEPPVLTVAMSGNPASCFGVCDGDATAAPAGGTSPYTYQWDAAGGLGTAATANGLCAGSPSVTITDANGCTVVGTFTIIEPPVLTVTTTATAASCFGVCDGSVTSTGAGGTSPYTYSWNNGLGAGQNHAGTVCAGTYTVTITDANGCTATATATVTQPPVLSVSTTATPASCFGVCDGSVTSTGAGGTSPYTYSWDNGLGAGQNHAGVVCAGTYTVTITDANGCTATATATVTQPPVMAVTATATPASCFGVCDGTVTANLPTGGTPPFTYAWDGGLGAGSSQTGVCAGTYTVTATDANGCTTTATVTVTEPPVLTVAMSGNPASCFGVCDGDATAAPAGGTSPYTYQWDAAGGLGTAATANGLCAGTASVTITDANGCTVVGTFTIIEPPVLTVTTTATAASCFGVCDGSVTSTGAGGTSPYTYSWNNGLGAGQNHAGTVCAGTYTVTITDANGCTATATATVTQPPVLSVSTTATPASCFGVCDGSVTSTGAGGTSPYTYSWNNGLGAGQNHAGVVCAGTYTVTITDANGCTATATATVTQPPVMAVTATATPASCFGVCDGTVTANLPTGGTPPFTYAWDGGLGAGSSQTGVCAGTYTVTATDANGCTTTATVTVTEPPVLTVAMSGNDVSCFGVCDGDATAAPAGGTSPYTYQWDAAGGLGTAATANGLCAGSPSVTITDANGCTVVGSFTINTPTAIVLSTSVTDPTCGNADGTASVTVTGGTSPYTYSWTSGGIAATETGLAAGGYTVTVTDANGCVETATVSLTDLGAPTATITASTNVSCFGGNDGSATVSASGGTSPYNYLWDDGAAQTTATATGLIAGTYSVTVTDAIGCVATANVTITQPPLLVVAITTSTNPSCAGVCDGTATGTASGGTSPYSYSWTTGGGAANETGICAGTETLTVTDANGCIATVNVTLVDPPVLTASIVGTDATCNTVCDGSADLTVAGGTAPFTYAWDNADVTQDISGLCAGTFNVTVTDANGCTAVASVTINEPAPIVITPTVTDATCGASNGSITVSVVGGTSPYTYAWPSGGTSATEGGLLAGSYTVTVTDANGCVETLAITVNDIGAGTGTMVADNMVSCFGACDGQATFTVAGGTTPYTYLWSTGGTASTESGLCAGTHTVDVTDASGCIVSGTVTITQPPVLTSGITASTNATCFGVCDGTATVTASGGTSPYTYSWTSGGTAANETGLCAGSHDVTVTDANGCTVVVSVVITEPAVLTAAIVGTDATCNTVCDGSADLTVAGGTSPFTYAWDNSDVTQDISGLCAGTFNVTVTDANGCTAVGSVTINEPAPIVITPTVTDATCGASNGSITVAVVGGTSPYTYAWPSGGTNPTEGALLAGSYTVTVTDANGCVETLAITVNDIGAGTGTMVADNMVSCFGACDGQATFTVAGGTTPYTYLWSTGGTASTESGLCAGTHTVDVTDASGCIVSGTVTITQPPVLTSGITASTNATCFGVCDGTATVTASGGTSPYTYSWTSGGTAANETGLCAGSHDVTVTDANGCTVVTTVVITEPAALTAAVVGTDVNCFGVCNGSADLTVAGGTTPYTYAWDNADVTQDISGLCAGTFNVTVTDANGCTAVASVTINEPTDLVLTIASVDANCGQADGSTCVTVLGGTSPYTYAWSNGPTTDCNNGITAGGYNVTVTDANGCVATASATINDLGGGIATATADNMVSCFGVCDGQATVSMVGGTSPYTYLWSTGGTGTTETGLCAGTHSVDVTDANGCIASATVTITEPVVLAIVLATTDATCAGACDGSIDATISGGVGPYTYLWDHGPTAEDLIGVLCVGSYGLTVTDANGCTAYKADAVNEPLPIVINNTSVLHVTCNGLCNGTIGVNATGGTGALTYDWVNDATTLSVGTNATETNICAGNYTVTITDANGCTETASVTVNEPGPMVLSTTTVDANCGQADGSACVIVAGGTSPFTYSWDSGQSTDCITNVLSGIYTVTVTDANGCIEVIAATINDLGGGTTTLTVDNHVSCFGVCDGQATIGIVGGTAPYTYAWSTGGNGTTESGLCAGNHSVTITDAVGCSSTENFTITEPLQLVAVTTPTDASCFGVCDGSATTVASDGTGPYTYLWTSGGTAATETGLCAGTYSVDITDANGCVITETTTINEPSEIIVTVSSTDANCGQSNGTLTASATGGAGGYTFDWTTGGSPVGNPGAVPAGSYDVLVTDASGCTNTATVGVADLTGPTITLVTSTDPLCNGNFDGTATVSVTGGTGGSTVVWTPGPISGTTATGLAAGSYTATATDATGCVATLVVVLTDPPVLDVTVTAVTDVSFNGGCDGDITVVGSGGTSPYTYQWYDDNTFANPILGEVSATISNLCAQEYCVIITDANGCTASVCASPNSPNAILVPLTGTDATCNGVCDGTITVTPSGGIAPFTYAWFDDLGAPIGQTTATATGLCAGTYYVEVTDQNGAGFTVQSANYVVNEPAPVSGTISVISNYNGQDISCTGACDGSAEIVPAGGTPPYSYNWLDNLGASIGQITPIATNLCAGDYTVDVTDNNGCTESFNVTVTEPAPLGNSFVTVDVSCYGACDGTITSSVTGGTSPYTYQWDVGLLTTANIIDQCAGTYNLTITDANGCTITQSVTLTEPTEVILTSSTVGANCGQSDGSATVSVVQGTGPFTYLWNAAAASQVTPTATNLAAGCYMVYVTDQSSGCVDSLDICVVDLGAPTVSILTQTDASCFGVCDGFIQMQVSGGVAPYNYQWCDNANNPLGPPSASPSFLNVCAGSYIGKMTDANGCTAFVAVTINEPTELIAAITNSVDVTCYGYCDGTATVTASGGTTPYSYLWSPTGQTGPTATALCPGQHIVTVTDANGCDSTISVTIGEPIEIALSTTTVDAFCNTASGSLTVNIDLGGVSPFTYVWDAAAGNQTSQTAINLVPGSYCVTVTDATGCVQTVCGTVGDIPAGVATTTNIINVSCFGGNDGSINFSMGGSGTPNYNYEWFTSAGVSTGITGTGPPMSPATGLTAGDYYVVVTDANGCVSQSNTSTITEPPVLAATTAVTDASCNGGCDGTATATVTGGTPGFTFLWNDPLNQTTNPATGLCAGIYDVTITDLNGCVFTVSATINEPTALALDSTVVDANCGQADGQACVLASGGVGGYSYLWPASAGSSTNSCVVGLPAGTYCVTVTDANGCSELICVEVSDVAGPTAAIVNTTMVSCNGLCDGSAEVDMVGGTGTFTVLWDASAGGQTTPVATNLCAGTYSVTITDDVGCSASTSVTITEPAPIAFNAQFSDPICFQDCNGEAWITATGGTAPYSYDWRDNLNTPIGTNNDTITGLCAGTYTLILTDANGCQEIIPYTITNPSQVTGTASMTPVSCFGGFDGTATANPTNGVGAFTYQWDDASTQTTQTATGLNIGTYTCIITDADGCSNTVSVTITQPPLLTAAINIFNDVSCNALCDGDALVDVAGGFPPYSYSWTNGAGATQAVIGLCAGNYTVTVTDANGCTATANVTINEPPALALSTSAVDASCFGSTDGSVTATVTGGNGSNTYQWLDGNGVIILGQTNATLANVGADTYTVIVTDALGCATSATDIVTEPTLLGLTFTPVDANCGQDNGSICINVVGGVAPVTVQWNDPNTQTSTCATNLFAGCYTVLLTDANGCTFDSLICLNDIAGPTITLNSFTDVSCNAAADGVIDFNVTLGTTPYASITWLHDGVAAPALDGLTLATGLSGGCYAITVVDGAGCTQSLQQCINEPAQLIGGITNQVDVSCFGGCDGTATVTGNGGTTPYTYQWNTGGTNPQETGMCAGAYSVVITDANGCTVTVTGTMNEPTQLTVVTTNVVNVSCNGGNDGSIAIFADGGTPPYLYSWTPNVGSGPNVNNLTAGNYSVQVTDAKGCVVSIPVAITEPPALVLTANAIPATCSQSNGSGTVTATGGTSPYSWAWPTGDVTSVVIGTLPIGTHNVVVTDAMGCTANIDVIIGDLPAPVIDSMDFINPSCNGLQNGSATVYASSPNGFALTYLWDAAANNQVAQTAVGLFAGTYCVTVTDINGCSTTNCITVTEPAPLLPVPIGTDTICYGDSTQLWATGQGGTLSVGSNYVIHWNGASTAGFSGGGPIMVSPTQTTDYCFTVEDEAGCLSPNACITITVTPELELDLTPPLSICDGETVTLNASATGGNGQPYNFDWMEGSSTGAVIGNGSTIDVSPSVDTWYYVLLTDGCSTPVLDSTQVSLNANPVVFLNVIDSTGCDPFTAEFTANSDIGVLFEWDFDCDGVIDASGNNMTSPTWLYDVPGTYDVCLTVTSADGCVSTISEPGIVTVHPTPVADFSFDPSTTTILNPTITFTDLSTGALYYDWNFGDGNSISGIDGNVPAGTNDGQTSGTFADPVHTYVDTGYFDITLLITNAWGCTSTITYTVHIEGDYILFAPSAFTPNGDGKNDYFYPQGVGIESDQFEMYIFDRWGEIVFESHHPDNYWDGTIKGTGIVGKTEVYVWLIRTTDYTGDAHEYIGHVTLLK